jgi:hypothetical protein
MKVSIIRPDNMVVVDGVGREVDLSDLDPAIHAIQFDSSTDKGEIEYVPETTELVEERDLEAEREATRTARKQNKREPGPITRRVPRPRGNRGITNFGNVAVYVARWRAAEKSKEK